MKRLALSYRTKFHQSPGTDIFVSFTWTIYMVISQDELLIYIEWRFNCLICWLLLLCMVWIAAQNKTRQNSESISGSFLYTKKWIKMNAQQHKTATNEKEISNSSQNGEMCLLCLFVVFAGVCGHNKRLLLCAQEILKQMKQNQHFPSCIWIGIYIVGYVSHLPLVFR